MLNRCKLMYYVMQIKAAQFTFKQLQSVNENEFLFDIEGT